MVVEHGAAGPPARPAFDAAERRLNALSNALLLFAIAFFSVLFSLLSGY
jgi:hypothetical protein